MDSPTTRVLAGRTPGGERSNQNTPNIAENRVETMVFVLHGMTFKLISVDAFPHLAFGSHAPDKNCGAERKRNSLSAMNDIYA